MSSTETFRRLFLRFSPLCKSEWSFFSHVILTWKVNGFVQDFMSQLGFLEAKIKEVKWEEATIQDCVLCIKSNKHKSSAIPLDMIKEFNFKRCQHPCCHYHYYFPILTTSTLFQKCNLCPKIQFSQNLIFRHIWILVPKLEVFSWLKSIKCLNFHAKNLDFDSKLNFKKSQENPILCMKIRNSLILK